MKCSGIVFFFIGVAVAYAQLPNKCTSPRTWEAKLISSEQERGFTTNNYGRIYYDSPNQRVLFTDEYYDTETREARYYLNFFFHKQGYQLRYDLQEKTCYNYSLTRPFDEISVPSDAKFVDTLVIGTNAIENLGVTVNVWSVDTDDRGRVVMEFVADDGDGDEDCLPISMTEFGGRTRGFRHQSFYDIVLGVNPDHFTRFPSDITCQKPPPPPSNK